VTGVDALGGQAVAATATTLTPHWIAGVPVESGSTLEIFDPARGTVIREVGLADPGLVDQAVAAAKDAFPEWSALPVTKRVDHLRRLSAAVWESRDELLTLVGEEHGKVRSDADGELARAMEVLDFACSAPVLLKGEFSDQVARGVDVHSMRMPLGVTAGITPFNFPVMVPLWMFPIALAAGNTFVLKPSERDPTAPTRLAQIATEAGLPDGVLNVVHGDKVAVDAICDHPDIASVSFVGSTPVAQAVYMRGTAVGKRVQALGGAKNHMVVLPDADLDFAADAATSAGYGSTGQRCMAVATVVAVGEIGDRLVESIGKRIEEIKVGPAGDDRAEMGPLATAAARDRSLSAIDAAESAGATVVADGRSHEVPECEEGFFVGPTLVDAVTTDMSVYREEIFGPVLSVLRVETLDEAISLINDNPYGNGAAIFTSSGAAARRFEREATAGMIGVNVPIPVPVSFHSFGGWKASLFGDRHLYGREGFEFFTRNKVITSRWPEQEAAKVSLSFPGS